MFNSNKNSTTRSRNSSGLSRYEMVTGRTNRPHFLVLCLIQPPVRWHVFLGFLGISAFPSSSLLVRASDGPWASCPPLTLAQSWQPALALVPNEAPTVLTGAEAHDTEAKHILEHFCVVVQEAKAQHCSKRHWLLTFYLDGRVLWFTQGYIWSAKLLLYSGILIFIFKLVLFERLPSTQIFFPKTSLKFEC